MGRETYQGKPNIQTTILEYLHAVTKQQHVSKTVGPRGGGRGPGVGEGAVSWELCSVWTRVCGGSRRLLRSRPSMDLLLTINRLCACPSSCCPSSGTRELGGLCDRPQPPASRLVGVTSRWSARARGGLVQKTAGSRSGFSTRRVHVRLPANIPASPWSRAFCRPGAGPRDRKSVV